MEDMNQLNQMDQLNDFNRLNPVVGVNNKGNPANDKINLNINDGEAFFAHQVSMNFSPTQFFIDFKCITPRMDERSSNRPSVSLKHNLVMLEPHHAKQVFELLGNMLKRYEDQFGKIDKPHAMTIIEKKNKELLKKNSKKEKDSKKDIKSANYEDKKKTDSPSYFG